MTSGRRRRRCRRRRPTSSRRRRTRDVGIVAELRAVFGNGEQEDAAAVRAARSDRRRPRHRQRLAARRSVAVAQALPVPLERQAAHRRGSRLGQRHARRRALGAPAGAGRPRRRRAARHRHDQLRARCARSVSDERAQRRRRGDQARGRARRAAPARPRRARCTRRCRRWRRWSSRASQAGPPNARAAVFHPERDAAGPDEPTRQWDARRRAACTRPSATSTPRELMARVKSAWRTNRRPFVLGGAAVWVRLLLGLIALKQPKPRRRRRAVPRRQRRAPIEAGHAADRRAPTPPATPSRRRPTT